MERKGKARRSAGSKTMATASRNQQSSSPFNGTSKRSKVVKEPTRSSNSTHLVRVKVIGLAGIQVHENASRRSYPRPPNRMKAVLAVARGQKIKATTRLSEPLTEPNSTAAKIWTDSPEKTNRHLAFWQSDSGDDSSALGASLEFEARLDRLDIGAGAHCGSSQYIPKTFDLIAALTEDTHHPRKVALPIGIASLPVSGSDNGAILAMDLPVLTLKQANPLVEDKNGLQGFQMISIEDKDTATKLPTKKSNFGRLMGKSPADDKCQRVPSVAERKSFSNAFYLDPIGDAVLRVQLQVIEKPNAFLSRPKSSLSNSQVEASTEPKTFEEATLTTRSIETASLTSDGAPSIRTIRQGSSASARKAATENRSEMTTPHSSPSTSERVRYADTVPPTTFSKQRKLKAQESIDYADFLPTCGASFSSDETTEETSASPTSYGVESSHNDNSLLRNEPNHPSSVQSMNRAKGTPWDGIKAQHSKFVESLWPSSKKIFGRKNGMEDLVSDASTEDLLVERAYGPTGIGREQKANNKQERKPNRLIDIIPCASVAKTLNEERTMDLMRGKFNVPSSALHIPERKSESDDAIPIIIKEIEFSKPVEAKKTPPKFCFPLPAAFGGPGLCSGLNFVDDREGVYDGLTANKIRSALTIRTSSESTKVENYFEDYDALSIDRPRSRVSTAERSGKV